MVSELGRFFKHGSIIIGLLFLFLYDPGLWGLPIVPSFPFSPVFMRQDWVGLIRWGPLFAGADFGFFWPACLLMKRVRCSPLCAVVFAGLVTYWTDYICYDMAICRIASWHEQEEEEEEEEVFQACAAQSSPVWLKTKWRFLSDYSLYVRSFLTRAALHAAHSTKALY